MNSTDQPLSTSSHPQIVPRSPGLSLLIVLVIGLLAGCGNTPHTPNTIEVPPQEPDLSLLTHTDAPVIDGETLPTWTALRSFYSQRQQQPVWVVSGTTTGETNALLAVLRAVDQEGLYPGDYHLAAIERRIHTATPSSALQGELELLLTDAALRYAHDQQTGRFEPQQMDPAWFIVPTPTPDSTAALRTALDTQHLTQWLAGLPPPHRDYIELRKALARYRALVAQGGWPLIEEGPKLTPGNHDTRVPILRRRFEISGELAPAEVNDASLYDSDLADTVRQFQARHGLDPDGIISTGTLRVLNVSALQRVRQLQLNMERWRWLPRQLEPYHIRINLAGFELQVMENDSPVLEMRVVVGRQLRSTPAFNSHLTHIVFNPYWTVPKIIATQDMLPKLRTNPAFLREQNIELFDSWDAQAQPIDSQGIDWSKYSAKHFPFRLRQRPGPYNALGQVKFLLPNAYDIYLHDTPNRELFKKSVRAFSSGCIRLQKPWELADYLLHANSKWNPATIADAIASQVTQAVRLPNPEPVYLVYLTAWADATGNVQFRDDLYERDARLDQAFRNVD